MKFSIEQVPYSRYGSFLVVSPLKGVKAMDDGLYIRTVHGGDLSHGAVFRIQLIRSCDNGGAYSPIEQEEIQITAAPEGVTISSRHGDAQLCITGERSLRMRASGVGIRLSMTGGSYDYASPMSDGRWEVNHFTTESRFMLQALQGGLKVEAPWSGTRCSYVVAELQPHDDRRQPSDSPSEAEAILQQFWTVRPPFTEQASVMEEAMQEAGDAFREWVGRTLPVHEKQWKEARLLAAYITWSCVVPQQGLLSRPAMYMSKNWMTNIWSWDHCFNAMALVQGQPQLAWDQFMIFFDVQEESGALPDFINDKYALWNCCKPPIHGWTLRWMLERSDWIDEGRLAEAYTPLCRWTNWWFQQRDDNGNGIPEYQHGNDCGWDNSTVFLDGGPVETPELCAFLILQCETLELLASRLRKPDEAAQWRRKAEELTELMLQRFWDGEKFVAWVRDEKRLPQGDSLLLYMPILLGKRLPEDVYRTLLEGLKREGRFLTEHGFATESIASAFYEADGYWRGPIWAPVMLLLVDGLAAAGESELARTAAQRFCRMAAASGMAENFDALTGAGLRDRAFTWTSSVFLILASEYA
ncbi:trehalase family glycosidase [Paenibacillus sp. J5C_2022]|uniref:amylo-alpha-1,6-glucosidase n=1 Tax=Paenibacillus sp. J5C2022 TaxID=2977129 RepID=UPI0021CEF9E0|nr:trehalase family glycosidase [Paenibacillus sp. J5C2022]MCU6708409.1 trehalase family glycosidase [Paenibacillus sp. J5C2022]